MISGNHVKTIREEMGLTQDELARELGFTISTISRWENGVHRISSAGQKIIEFWLAKNRYRMKQELKRVPPNFDSWIRMLDRKEREWAEAVASAVQNEEPMPKNHQDISRVKAKLIMYHVKALLE